MNQTPMRGFRVTNGQEHFLGQVALQTVSVKKELVDPTRLIYQRAHVLIFGRAATQSRIHARLMPA